MVWIRTSLEYTSVWMDGLNGSWWNLSQIYVTVWNNTLDIVSIAVLLIVGADELTDLFRYLFFHFMHNNISDILFHIDIRVSIMWSESNYFYFFEIGFLLTLVQSKPTLDDSCCMPSGTPSQEVTKLKTVQKRYFINLTLPQRPAASPHHAPARLPSLRSSPAVSWGTASDSGSVEDLPGHTCELLSRYGRSCRRNISVGKSGSFQNASIHFEMGCLFCSLS